MLAGWVRGWAWLRPWGGWSAWPDLPTKHLLSADPSGLLVSRRKPWSNNLLGQVHIPHRDQVLVESLIPHETTAVVRSIRNTSKQISRLLFYDFAVFIDHPVTIHVRDRAQHITQGIFGGFPLSFGPVLSVGLKESRFNFTNTWFVNKSLGELVIKFKLSFFKIRLSIDHFRFFRSPSFFPIPKVKVHSERQLIELLHCDQVARKGIIFTIKTCWVEQVGRCRPDSILQLIEEVFFRIVLIMFIDL